MSSLSPSSPSTIPPPHSSTSKTHCRHHIRNATVNTRPPPFRSHHIVPLLFCHSLICRCASRAPHLVRLLWWNSSRGPAFVCTSYAHAAIAHLTKIIVAVVWRLKDAGIKVQEVCHDAVGALVVQYLRGRDHGETGGGGNGGSRIKQCRQVRRRAWRDGGVCRRWWWWWCASGGAVLGWGKKVKTGERKEKTRVVHI